MSFAVGSLVRARGRDWVVLPESADDMVIVRPLGGTDAETVGILTDIETVEAASFAPPAVADRGDFASARLLRDALRLGFRSSAGPFRSFGELAVEPRSYQLVPLLMALRQDTARLLIADDVGIGKTVEAGLIAKELLSTGAARRLAVLCPPHLAEQWQRELSEKFHLEAELVLSSTAARLERQLVAGESLFERHLITVVSLDFIKSARRRDDFVRACPDLVIVDEAHTCADSTGSGSRHQRYELLRQLSADENRHLLLVTATPHSGKDEAFRSLLSLLDPQLANLPDDMSGDHNRAHRERLARHLVQRRRGDVHEYRKDDPSEVTPFPERHILEVTYRQRPEYAQLLDDVLSFARETVMAPGNEVRQRVRWWSALGLLRAISSSPAAASATLRTRAANAAVKTVEQVDEAGRDWVLDPTDAGDESTDALDTVFGVADIDDDAAQGDAAALANARRLAAFAERAVALEGAGDAKLAAATKQVKALIADGYQPIVFCRFIETAKYVARELDRQLKKVTVECVTGELPPVERENRIEALTGSDSRVLVATDCLSEGINLQHLFDAVVHYDLPWNPTRLEQREGRVDRFGQLADVVRVLTITGDDNPIDNIVREVLVRKHRAIKKALGVSIPVPGTANDVLEALADRLLNVETTERVSQGAFDLNLPETKAFSEQWELDAKQHEQSRTKFRQEGIKVDEVIAEVAAARRAIGGELDVRHFVESAVRAHRGAVEPRPDGSVTLLVDNTPVALRDRLSLGRHRAHVAYRQPAPAQATVVSRTHPLVTSLAGHVLDTALDPVQPGVAARAGVMRSSAVSTRTTVVLARFRHQVVVKRRNRSEHPMLAETAAVLAFTGPPSDPTWLEADEAEDLLNAGPTGSVSEIQAEDFLEETLIDLEAWRTTLDERASVLAEELAESHRRVRDGGRVGGAVEVTPTLPVDVLGAYVVLPEVAR